MRYAILGDIHSNLAALESVLEALEDEVIDQILQVGDVVGYNYLVSGDFWPDALSLFEDTETSLRCSAGNIWCRFVTNQRET